MADILYNLNLEFGMRNDFRILNIYFVIVTYWSIYAIYKCNMTST